jgi:T5SS/PEP-CTERM-associated repeat protein
MVVSNGASVVLNSALNVGHGPDTSPHTIGSSDNTLIVTGLGTTLTNTGSYIDVGDWGASSGNLMVISNQALVSNAYTFYIGYDTNSTSNSTIVTGTNSRLINGGNLDLGDYGSGNSLVISNGAYASFAGNNYISYYAGSSNNSVAIFGNSTLSVLGDSQIGGGGSYNSAIVTGSNALWTNSGDITLGASSGSSGNSLVISNGGKVYGANLWIGDGYSNQSNNSVLITGEGSEFIAADYVDVGYYGAGPNHSLVVSNGGLLVSSTGIVGEWGGATNNFVTLTGAGSTWSNSGTITIGDAGIGTVNIASGGTLISSNISIAANNDSTGILNVGTYGDSDTNITLNAPTISFGSSYAAVNFNQADVLTNTSAFGGNAGFNGYSVIAQLGSGTTILAGNGTGVTNGADIVFVNGGLVIGTNAVYNSTGSIYVGYQGVYGVNGWNSFSNTSGVSMVIKDGAQVSLEQSVYIGYGTSNSNNSLLVTGPGTVVSSYEIYLDGNNNTMTVSNRASVTSADEIDIGDWSGNSNRLIVAGGGTITAMQDDTIGGNGFSGNALIVTGSNSLFTNAQYGITVGYGNSNYITVANGGTLCERKLWYRHNDRCEFGRLWKQSCGLEYGAGLCKWRYPNRKSGCIKQLDFSEWIQFCSYGYRSSLCRQWYVRRQ